MKTLILTHRHDLHSHIVMHALQAKGEEPVLWSIPEFGSADFAAVRIGPQTNLKPSLAIAGTAVDLDQIGTVWARRPTFPRVPPDVDLRDQAQVRQENGLFMQGLWWALSDQALWVNPYSIRRYVKSKPMQLKVAKLMGIRIPDTVFGNDAAQIRAFIDDHAASGVIYKPHRIAEWEEEGTRFLLHTSEIGEIEFSDRQFEACAGTYQAKIAKKYELRIHIFGTHIVAIKIDSQAHAGSQLDWRSVNPGHLEYEVVELAADTIRKLHEFMSNFGLVFGIVDAIVTPDNEFVFLEVNEMGQFLWADAYCKGANLLDHFCSLLISRDRAYSGQRIGEPVDYLAIRNTDQFSQAYSQARTQSNEPEYLVDWIDVLI